MIYTSAPQTIDTFWLWLNHWDATKHKFWVMWYVLRVCFALIRRGLTHDLSKYSTQEAVSFKAWTLAIRGLSYDTTEYQQVSASFAGDNALHYSVNRHHPEYWPDGLIDMSPLDRLEMLCDWSAKSRGGLGIIKSVEYNASRFNYNETTQNGFIRDAREALN